jgi:hypothetical protein
MGWGRINATSGEPQQRDGDSVSRYPKQMYFIWYFFFWWFWSFIH